MHGDCSPGSLSPFVSKVDLSIIGIVINYSETKVYS